MNSIIISNSIRFIVLILVQALLLSSINFLGYINPYIYVLFILLFPANNNRSVFIALSFILGLTLDLFIDSGGVHAVACVTIAYIRPVALKFSFGTLYDHHSIKFNETELLKRATYITLLVVIHHLILFSLEIFSTAKVILILKKSLFSSIFTIMLCVLITVLFSKKNK